MEKKVLDARSTTKEKEDERELWFVKGGREKEEDYKHEIPQKKFFFPSLIAKKKPAIKTSVQPSFQLMPRTTYIISLELLREN